MPVTGSSTSSQPPKASLLENWVSLFGALVAVCSFLAVAVLILMDIYGGLPNPYLGILTYMVAPGFLVGGLILIGVGVILERRRRRGLAEGEIPRHPVIDLNNRRHQRNILVTGVVAFLFLVITGVGSYRTYHFTESVEFCGQTCHTVMKPEFTAYQTSPHARVACVQCHIGPGADWFVKSKLSGAYQVYATLRNIYPRPIPTPIENLRPAQETCEQCHWPQMFFGNVERVNDHFFSDDENTPWTIRLLMKIGGGDPEHGRAGGIHWHMNIANTVEYIATDHSREVIPWVRITDGEGNVTIYQSESSPLTEEELATLTPRQMDCIDCHNRPSHIYRAPARAVNLAMSTGRISTEIPGIKRRATQILTAEYETTDEALVAISAALEDAYAGSVEPDLLAQADTELRRIYETNFFPEMKVNWRVYPDHVGHTLYPGCYRCHDGQHTSSDGKVITHDCNACHIIISQGTGEMAETLSPAGLEFIHPTDIGEMWKFVNCSVCHTGGPSR
jgi:hypothetical protein